MNEKAEKYWNDRWYESHQLTYRVNVNLPTVRDARNFAAFVNRRFPGFATRDGATVTMYPMKPSVARGLMAAHGRVGELYFENI